MSKKYELHTIENPLLLRYAPFSATSGYLVNKPEQGDQKLVSLEYAQKLEKALLEAGNQIEYLHGKFKETGSGNQVLSTIKALTQKS